MAAKVVSENSTIHGSLGAVYKHMQASRQSETQYLIVEFGARSSLLVKLLLFIVVTEEKIYYE